jgi:transcriptional regulator with PAS, ATPase and Fis domain
MQEVFELILKTSASNINVVINGESGTGKELVAQAIHDLSSRHGNEFVAVNCGAIPETLLESEFFGYKKGAFTGALMDKHGYLDLADKGILFLDEVTELGLNMQAKLLRAIDGGGYIPVGSNKTKKSDFRIIAATNMDLMDQVNRGLIREDFFYRINVISITVPPLRDRKGDIPLLIEHFLKLLNQGEKPTVIPEKIIEAMYNYHWPGNVRELQNVLHRYLTVKRLDFMNSNTTNHKVELDGGSGQEFNQEKVNLSSAVENLEKNVISKALGQTHWNKSKTAMLLGISRRALYRKMKNFEMI